MFLRRSWFRHRTACRYGRGRRFVEASPDHEDDGHDDDNGDNDPATDQRNEQDIHGGALQKLYGGGKALAGVATVDVGSTANILNWDILWRKVR